MSRHSKVLPRQIAFRHDGARDGRARSSWIDFAGCDDDWQQVPNEDLKTSAVCPPSSPRIRLQRPRSTSALEEVVGILSPREFERSSLSGQTGLDVSRPRTIIEEDTEWEEESSNHGKGAYTFLVCTGCGRMVFAQYKNDKVVVAFTATDLTNKVVMTTCQRCEAGLLAIIAKKGEDSQKAFDRIPIHVDNFSGSRRLEVARLVAGQEVPLAQINDNVLHVRRDEIKNLGSKEDKMRSLDASKLESGDLDQIMLPFLHTGFM